MRPDVCEKRSQMDSPLPSSFQAPSTWYDAVAVPQLNPPGNVTFLTCTSVRAPAPCRKLLMQHLCDPPHPFCGRSATASSSRSDVPRKESNDGCLALDCDWCRRSRGSGGDGVSRVARVAAEPFQPP